MATLHGIRIDADNFFSCFRDEIDESLLVNVGYVLVLVKPPVSDTPESKTHLGKSLRRIQAVSTKVTFTCHEKHEAYVASLNIGDFNIQETISL